MSGSGNIPSAVLSQQLGDALDGRTVRAAVFTTYTFDPGFFELHVGLPVARRGRGRSLGGAGR